jgi:hypothetical protein
MAIWFILLSFGLFYFHLVYFWPLGIFMAIWNIFSGLGMLYKEKSGNPELPRRRARILLEADEVPRTREILWKFYNCVCSSCLN